jgi:ELWxxDGT repeat protein
VPRDKEEAMWPFAVRKMLKSYEKEFLLQQLEERIVLDAALDPAVKDNTDNPSNTANSADLAAQAPEQAASGGSNIAAPAVPDNLNHVFNHDLNVVLISNALVDVQTLSNAAGPDAKVIVYDAANDNLTSITGKLQETVNDEGGHKIDHLAILSHGDVGLLKLTQQGMFDTSSLQANAAQWQILGSLLSENARIDLYGCDIGKDPQGLIFVNTLATVSGVTVWGSNDSTGSIQGADWELEVHSAANALPGLIDASRLEGTSLYLDSTPYDVSMVKDTNQQSTGSAVEIEDVNGTIFFVCNDASNGSELWKSDGTAAGTVLVKDIVPGSNGSSPDNLTNVNGTLFFTSMASNGVELWKSDGTAAGTVLVKDIYAGSTGSAPDNLTNVNGILYFTANDGTSGYELWKSDGTAAGTVLVKDIYAGSTGSNPDNLTNVNGALFFTADDETNGRELWKSDGTAAGTVLVKDIYVGSTGSAPGGLTNVNGMLFFTADDETNGRELWKSDGTEAGTVLVKDIYVGSTGSAPSYRANVDGMLFFSASDGINGNELWKSDGTAAGTVLVKDIHAGVFNSNPSYLTNVNGTLFFSAGDGMNGNELWKSDGTAAGTVLVKDIYPGSLGIGPYNMTSVNNTLFFTVNDGTHGLELWKSDGTQHGTVMVGETIAGAASGNPLSLTSSNGTLFFGGSDESGIVQLWKSDGTEAGMVTVTHLWSNGSTSPTNLTGVNDTLFFAANDGTHGNELWKSDGTAAGTVLVKDIYVGGDSSPSYLTNVNGTLFFLADDGTHGRELWKSDGTAAGTVLVKDVCSGLGYSYIAEMTSMNGTLFFSADDGTHGRELWKSDGTAAGTVLVKDIYAGNSSSPCYLTKVNGTLFFRATDGTSGSELWKGDGTEAGTVLVKEIFTGSTGSAPGALTNVNGMLFFSADDGTHGRELWKSDGTAAGTVLVKDISSTGSSGPSSLTVVNGTLFFQAYDTTSGYELWKSDGTAAGTVLVKDIYAGSTGSAPGNLTNVNGILFFTASYTPNSWQLWKSDGTSAGTVLVKHYTGIVSHYPANLTDFNGTLFFQAYDATTGRELWKSDGTEAGTERVVDIYPGVSGSTPQSQTNVNGTLFFAANDGSHGFELWRAEALIANNTPTDMALVPSDITENQTAGTIVGSLSTVDPDVGDTWTYSLVAGAGDTDNASFTIDGSNLKTAASFDYETKNSYSIRVRVTDAGSLTYEEVFTIHVSNENDNVPTAQGPIVAPSLNEDGSVAITVHGTDGDDPAVDEVSFDIVSGHTVQHGTLTPGTLTEDSPGHYSQVFTYTPAPNWYGTDGFQFSFTSEDQTAGAVDVGITVNAVNDAPVNAVPLTVQTVPNGGVQPFVLSSQYENGISIYDADAGGNVVQVTLTATNGTMSLYIPYASGVTFVTGDGTLDTTMSLTGTMSSINAALSWIKFYATPNYGSVATSASLAIVTDDLGNTGIGGSQTDTDTVAFSVAPHMNAAPVNAVPLAVQTVPNGGVQPFVLSSQYENGISIYDADAGGNVVQVTLTATDGTMSLYLPYASGVTFVTGDGTRDTTMSMTGTIANINAALSWVNFYATPNYGSVATSASLAIVTDDLGNTGVGGSRTDSDTVAFSVAPHMNAAPVNAVPLTVQTVPNGGIQPLVLSSQYENGISIYDADAGGNVVQVTLAATNGTMSLYLPYASGVTFVTGDGTRDTTMSMTGTIANINAALSWVNFYATPNYGSVATSASLAILTDDLGNTGIGGSQTDTDTISFSVAPHTNAAPVNAVPLAVQTISDGGLQRFVLSKQYDNGISIWDADAGGNVVQVTLAATNGTMSLYLPYASGVTFVTGDGTLDTTMSMTGTIANINAALSWLNFYATPNHGTTATSASLAIVTDDFGNTGAGGSQTDTDTVSFTVQPIV